MFLVLKPVYESGHVNKGRVVFHYFSHLLCVKGSLLHCSEPVLYYFSAMLGKNVIGLPCPAIANLTSNALRVEYLLLFFSAC